MDFYLVLGLERAATVGDIKRAYKRLARRYHPDINPGDRLAAAQFRQIADAYETLSDPDLRRRYDTAGSSRAPAEALLVPDTAIGTEQVRKFVYAVGPDNVAKPKYVTLGPVVDGLRVVKTGLDADDLVIVNGLMRVRPGSKVTPEQAKAEPGNQDTSSVRTN